MINRRAFLGLTAGASAALAFPPELLRALQRSSSDLIQRAIPSTGETLPVIGLGARAGDPAAIAEVMRTLLDGGAKVVDTLHGGPPGEQVSTTVAHELGISDKLFWVTNLGVTVPLLPGYAGPPPKVDPAAVRAEAENKIAAFRLNRMDLFQVPAHADIPTHLAVLREMKKEGRVRYIGVHELLPPTPNATDRLEGIMRNEELDFIGVDYSVGDRRIEAKILPLAQERKIGVMAYFTFDRSRIFQRASAMPLPEWAAEFDAKTWAQFFLKYVVSHPAVTVARTGTTKAHHMLDNLAGGMGRLPDEATRQRMAAFVDTLPPTPAPTPPQPPAQPQGGQQRPQAAPVVVPLAVLDRYVGEYLYAATGQIVTVRRDGERLFLKITGNAPEGPLVPRSETQFAAPFGATVEFRVDGQRRVVGAEWVGGPFRIPLERR